MKFFCRRNKILDTYLQDESLNVAEGNRTFLDIDVTPAKDSVTSMWVFFLFVDLLDSTYVKADFSSFF